MSKFLNKPPLLANCKIEDIVRYMLLDKIADAEIVANAVSTSTRILNAIAVIWALTCFYLVSQVSPIAAFASCLPFGFVLFFANNYLDNRIVEIVMRSYAERIEPIFIVAAFPSDDTVLMRDRFHKYCLEYSDNELYNQVFKKTYTQPIFFKDSRNYVEDFSTYLDRCNYEIKEGLVIWAAKVAPDDPMWQHEYLSKQRVV